MNILLISQCNKKALPETRRVLDQFAERKGDRTWQTPITKQGLDTLRKLLKKTARRNTAVACHWIRSKNHTELLWIVGNQRKFNIDGTVPTNITRRNILKTGDENAWHTAEDMALLSGIAALFHDFGKANNLFQDKINPEKNTQMFEPYRHEWVSLRLFQSFVGELTDSEWLEKLANITPKQEREQLANLYKDDPSKSNASPFKALPPVAKAVAWLILTHHKLPFYKSKKDSVKIKYAEQFLEVNLKAVWNSPQIIGEWKKSDIKTVWSFKTGTPVKSKIWCTKANRIGKRALNRNAFIYPEKPWLEDNYTLHLSRLALMLADHHYSSLDAIEAYKCSSYKAFANSDRNTKQLKQKLDEHLIGVYKHSLRVVRMLSSLKSSLPAITDIRALKKRNTIKRFQWQDKSFDLAKAIAEPSEQQGFFGINMASTGRGKTLANARIMYGLSNQREGCRFSVALGLRTLTLQTGDALKQRLKLAEDDIAVLIGSQAVKQLHDLAKQDDEEKASVIAPTDNDRLQSGSESENDLIEDEQYVQYQGQLSQGALSDWLKEKPKLNKLVSAPILVSTIDHLIPATESQRGGKQIAPMLRLLTSDLVLDEPDDFDIADLPALTRLVNWAGLLGSRVLLSSATLPPDAVVALFESYKAGRVEFNRARNSISSQGKHAVQCAWFDEFNVAQASCNEQAGFEKQHQKFIEKRINKLVNQPALHKAIIAPVQPTGTSATEIITSLTASVSEQVYRLHQNHSEASPCGKRVSIGLVRMANINPLVALAQQLANSEVSENYHLHICVYHSQFPLIQRSNIESTLDAVLDRNEPEKLWQQKAIKQGLQQSTNQHHIFIVLATAVAEVGRDWDLDWAIAEPSSIRSIIQLAGRVQRHRRQMSEHPNIALLASNYRALNSPRQPAFCKPGFETVNYPLTTHWLNDLLLPEQYQVINSVPRVSKRDALSHTTNLVDLEHHRLYQAMFKEEAAANNWWHKSTSWTYQFQSETPFRASSPSSDYFMQFDQVALRIKCRHKNGEAKYADAQFDWKVATKQAAVSWWGKEELAALLHQHAETIEQELNYVSAIYGVVNLRDKQTWCISNEFGIYQQL